MFSERKISVESLDHTSTGETDDLDFHLEELGRKVLEAHPESSLDSNELFPVPRGWTVLIHGTDAERWQLGESVKKIEGSGLSAVTKEDIARDHEIAARMGNPEAFNTTKGYSGKRNKDGQPAQPVEAHIFFYRADLAPRRVPMAEVADLKASLSAGTQELISKYHRPRHPVIPRNENLLLLGQEIDEETGRIIEYFVPESVAEDYLEAVQRSQ